MISKVNNIPPWNINGIPIIGAKMANIINIGIKNRDNIGENIASIKRAIIGPNNGKITAVLIKGSSKGINRLNPKEKIIVGNIPNPIQEK